MGILSSAFRSVNPISLVQVGLGPAGWTSMAMRMAVSQAVQAGIQQFGQGMGLPQFAIDMMQSRAAGSLGDFRGQFSNYREAMGGLNRAINASPFQAARNERMAEQTYDKVFEIDGEDAEASAGRSDRIIIVKGRHGEELDPCSGRSDG